MVKKLCGITAKEFKKCNYVCVYIGCAEDNKNYVYKYQVNAVIIIKSEDCVEFAFPVKDLRGNNLIRHDVVSYNNGEVRQLAAYVHEHKKWKPYCYA